MRAILCPTSTQRVDATVARGTGLLMAGLLVLYVVTGQAAVAGLVAADFAVRAFTPLRHSPASWLAARALRRARPVPIDKAPKVFAARVGFLVAATATALAAVSPAASAGVAGVLVAFALLEAGLGLCVGCVAYTYLVRPFSERRPWEPPA